MRVVVLNWKTGENDPFSAFNRALVHYLESCGKETAIVEISEADWVNKIIDHYWNGIDFVFTWQGLGSRRLFGEQKKNLWDHLRIPLISFDGDHPCHMPANQASDSQYCVHLYAAPEFARYASRHFRKRTRAISMTGPLFCLDKKLELQGPPCFVLPKNLTHPQVMESEWKRTLDPKIYTLTMQATEILKMKLGKTDHLDFHHEVDTFLLERHSEALDHEAQPDAFHAFHSRVDFYIRNLKSVRVLEELRDIPLQIVGRGWEPCAKKSNPKHEFRQAGNLEENQWQYYSQYGVIDVTASVVGMHDRTCRAIRNERPFLTSAYLPDLFPNIEAYDPVFFSFREGNLRERCEWVLENPKGHADLCLEFGYLYQMNNRPESFVWTLDNFARMMAQRS